MNTDQLIDLLARDVEPAERPHWRRRMAWTLLVGLVSGVALLALGFGMRPDIGTAQLPVLLKALFAAASAAAALPLVARLMRPGRPLGWRLGAVLAFAGLCALVTVIALLGEAPGERLRAWTGGGFPWCLVVVPVLAAPTAAGLLWLMRGFAPTRLTLAGAAIGALSGGIGAMAYAMYCPVDSVAFVTTWYVLAIALCAALGAVVGARFLRW